jgi:hypothetical protein
VWDVDSYKSHTVPHPRWRPSSHVIVFGPYRRRNTGIIWLRLLFFIPMVISRRYPNASSSSSTTSTWHTSRAGSPSWRHLNCVSHQRYHWCFRSRKGKYMVLIHVRLSRKLGTNNVRGFYLEETQSVFEPDYQQKCLTILCDVTLPLYTKCLEIAHEVSRNNSWITKYWISGYKFICILPSQPRGHETVIYTRACIILNTSTCHVDCTQCLIHWMKNNSKLPSSLPLYEWYSYRFS